LAPATNPNRTKIWVILLEGGQWCWDAQSCGIRSQQNPALTTSSIWPPHMSQTGIFNDIVSLVNTGILTFNICN
jgi:hypothetical protein